MIARLVSLAVIAAASATFSAAAAQVYVNVGPPASRFEAVPAARPGYLWTPGYWNWRGNRHHWVAGNWVRERRGYVYTQPTWVQDNDRWRFNRGAWTHRDDYDRNHDHR
ncbi:MAG TPA: YXWGXW repeat-containing protein [Caldimonas sp.]|nr:YXWGXW repeat-containing protein [Caldimonas sp.]